MFKYILVMEIKSEGFQYIMTNIMLPEQCSQLLEHDSVKFLTDILVRSTS